MFTKHLPLVLTISILCAIGSTQASGVGPHRSRSTNVAHPWNMWLGATGGPFNAPSSPDNWLGGAGNWSNSADWSAGLPGSSSDVTINTGSDNVTLDTSPSINSLVLGGATGRSQLTDNGNPHMLTIAGALTVNQSGYLYLPSGDTMTAGASSANLGNIDLEFSSSLQVNGDLNNSGGICLGCAFFNQSYGNVLAATGTLTNSGSIALGFYFQDGMKAGGGSLTAGKLVNTGSIGLSGMSYGTIMGSLVNEGSIGLGAGGNAFYVYGDATNSGSISTGGVHSGDVLSIAGKLTNTATGILNLEGSNGAGSEASVGFLTNAGTILVGSPVPTQYLVVTGGSHAAPNALPGFLNTGIVNISLGGALTSVPNYVQTSGQTIVDGRLLMVGNAIANFAGGAVYGNGGTIYGAVVSNAAINIGDSPMTIGQLFMMGNYTQGANGSLTFDIAGAAAGQYDQLNVSGKAKFNGLMTVNLLNGFVPQIGDMFDIMNFAGGSGTFSKVLGLPINSQEHFMLEYNPTNLTLDVVPGQDTNIGDAWSSISASAITWVPGNGVYQGMSSNGVSDPTPEPSSILLVGSGLLGIAAVLRRKRSI